MIRTDLEKGGRPKTAVLVQEAILTAKAGMRDEGLRLIEDVTNEHREDANAWNAKGLIHGMRREDEKQAECFGRASELAPNDLVFRGNYGVALHQTGKHAEAAEVMRDALSRDSELTYLHSWLADAFLSLNNPDEMKKELERWYGRARRQTLKFPEDEKAWEELVLTATRLGKYEEADEAREYIRELKRDRNLLAGPGHG